MTRSGFSETTALPVAAQYNSIFFKKSETFIYHYLIHLERYIPLCLSWRLENIEQFSFDRGFLTSLQLKRFSPQWWYYGLRKRILGGLPYFEKILRRSDAGILHAHFGHNGASALEVSRKLKIPLLTTFYGLDLSSREVLDALLPRYRQLFAEGEAFLVEGPFMRERLIQLGCPGEKVHIQRIAIPLDRMVFHRREPRKKDDPVRFIFAGRFVEKKGLIYALKAFLELRRIRKGFRFLIIGDGRLDRELREFVRRNRMEDYVQFLGFLDYSSYLEEMQRADIFIHPSVTAADGDSEGGAPTTILEAQAMGLPVIASLHADIPNVVVPDRSALLAPEFDVAGIVRHILHLLDNQDRWAEMGAAGRAFISKYHDIRSEVTRLEDLYDRFSLK